MPAGRNNAGGGPGGERAGRRPSCRSSGGAYAPIQRGVRRAQDERSAGRPPLQMKGRPLTLRTCSASEQHSVGPPQRRARPSRLKGVLEARGAAGLEQGVALRRLQLDELDLGRQRGDRGLVLELLRRRGLAPVRERADLCARIFFNFFYDDIETRRFGLCTGANAAFVVLDHGARLVDFPAGIEALGSAARRCRGRETSKRRGGALLLLLAELRLLDEHLLYFLGHDWR